MAETSLKDTTTAYPLPSGATLHMGRPLFKACGDLKRALARAGGARPLTPEEMKLGLDGIKDNPSAGGALLQRIIQAASSEEVEAAAFSCLVQSSYEPADAPDARIKITPALFDDERFGDAARADFYPILIRVLGVAVVPFLGPLASMYREFLTRGRSSPASPPTPSQNAS